jgi:hypothetical protein
MKRILFPLAMTIYCMASTAQVSIQYKTREERLNEQLCSGLFKSSQGIIVDVGNEQVRGYFNILDWLVRRVAGLQVQTTKYGDRIALIRGNQACVFVDEVQVTTNYLNNLPVSEILMIKVIRFPFMGGFNCNGGAIAIYTVNSDNETTN